MTLLPLSVVLLRGEPATALDYVTIERNDETVHVDGEILATARDGGLLLLARDGILWAVQPDELVRRSEDKIPFEPYDAAQIAKRVQTELPAGFQVHATTHYLICYNTSPAYAQWCGSLFERLYMAFTNYWSRKGFDLIEPDFPLVAIVFSSQSVYVDYSRPELGEAAEAIIGYFSLRTNRMAMYDLTGLERVATGRSRLNSAAQINRILARPDATRIVATVVHEATHQIAFNCGLHQRYSDCPLWFSEGIAIYFETPDLGSTRGWRGIGSVNRPRLLQFRQYLRKRPPNSLESLIATDDRFRDTATAPDAYAEAWALTYFLLNHHERQYIDYLEMLSEKRPLFWDDADTRLKEFREAFGDDLDELDRRFVRFIMNVN